MPNGSPSPPLKGPPDRTPGWKVQVVVFPPLAADGHEGQRRLIDRMATADLRLPGSKGPWSTIRHLLAHGPRGFVGCGGRAGAVPLGVAGWVA